MIELLSDNAAVRLTVLALLFVLAAGGAIGLNAVELRSRPTAHSGIEPSDAPAFGRRLAALPDRRDSWLRLACDRESGLPRPFKDANAQSCRGAFTQPTSRGIHIAPLVCNRAAPVMLA